MTRIGIPAHIKSVITSIAKPTYPARTVVCVDKQEPCTCGFQSTASGRQCRKKSIASARCVTATKTSKHHKNCEILRRPLSTTRRSVRQTEILTTPIPITLRASEMALNSSMDTTDSSGRQVTCLPMPEVIIFVKKPPLTMPIT